jgi:glucose uptake protein GlcU
LNLKVAHGSGATNVLVVVGIELTSLKNTNQAKEEARTRKHLEI